jgi:hypothetical protein
MFDVRVITNFGNRVKMGRQREASNDNPEPRIDRISPKGLLGLVFTIGIILVLLAEEALRGFFLLSLLLGVTIACVLYLWHKRHPCSDILEQSRVSCVNSDHPRHLDKSASARVWSGHGRTDRQLLSSQHRLDSRSHVGRHGSGLGRRQS